MRRFLPSRALLTVFVLGLMLAGCPEDTPHADKFAGADSWLSDTPETGGDGGVAVSGDSMAGDAVAGDAVAGDAAADSLVTGDTAAASGFSVVGAVATVRGGQATASYSVQGAGLARSRVACAGEYCVTGRVAP